MKNLLTSFFSNYVGLLYLNFNINFYSYRKLSGSEVGWLFPGLLHGHPAGRHQEAGQRSPSWGSSLGCGRRRKPGLHRLYLVHRPRLHHQQDLLCDRDRGGPEDHPHRRAPHLRCQRELHAVGGVRQRRATRTEGVRPRRGAESACGRERETDLHATARGILRALDGAGDRGGGSGPGILLCCDRGPPAGALGPCARQDRPLGVLIAVHLPASG